MESFIPKF